MRYFFSCFLITLLSFGLFVNEASAKRFGGGRSFGVQRSQSSLYSSQKNQYNNAFNKNTTQGKSKWGGILGGLLLGSLLGSLFMGNGFASGMMSWLLLAAAAFFIINWLRRRAQPIAQTAQSTPFQNSAFNPFQQFTNTANTGTTSANDFASDEFIRQAKVSFIRLQAAYDQKNLDDLQSFTLPEVYAEIKMQLDERGNELNQTEVIRLDAQLLDVEKQAQSTIASVRFTGTLKENNQSESLDEIWHFRQMAKDQPWLVGGIQQEVHQP